MSRARTPMPWRAKNSTAELQEADGGFGLLIGQHLGEGHARVIVDGHVQGQEAGWLLLAAQPPIATQQTSEKRVIPLISRCSRSPGRDARSAVWAVADSDRAIGSALRGAGCG